MDPQAPHILKQQNLANGMALTFYDCSRPVAADRWFVKVRAELSMALPERVWQGVAEEDQGLLAAVRECMGEAVVLQLVRERNFIDAAERESVIGELIEQVESNLGSYLADPAFPDRLFSRQYSELRQQCLLSRQVVSPAGDADEDEGPADFSHCFRD